MTSTGAIWHREAVKYRTVLLSIQHLHEQKRKKCATCGERWPCWTWRAIDEVTA